MLIFKLFDYNKCLERLRQGHRFSINSSHYFNIKLSNFRYGGPPPTPQDEKERIAQLQLENEELKSEVTHFQVLLTRKHSRGVK